MNGGPPTWEIIPTTDGSHTLVSKDGLLTFHSRHGAITESRHVFEQMGLDCWLAAHAHALTTLRVLEMGLGTGLNAALVLEGWRRRLGSKSKNGDDIPSSGYGSLNWSYTALETQPLDPLLLGKLNYGAHLHHGAWEDWLAGYRAMYPFLLEASHQPDGSECVGEGFKENTSLKIESTESQMVMKVWPQGWVQPLEEVFDVIFYDAFGPSAQPELWGEQAVTLLAQRLSKGGVMVTYGAQGAFRRHLRQAGLLVERLPGPPGKREMLRAVKG
ncbi:MAG: tRNA (5-methylaminomethyl-2-thiouridine)(34)-methyltransferase MnmD [Bacteroidota bacterium]